MVYLIHFDKPYKHAQHYIGYCEDSNLDKRFQRHCDGHGSKLLKAVRDAGIGFQIVKVWPKADRAFERKLHNRKNSKQLCPICKEGN